MSTVAINANARSGQWSRLWFPVSAGLICFLWALIALVSLSPNSDILADGIQVHSLLSDPRVVLAFPGQKHGGPLEYPYTLLAEHFFPGNYFANAAIRPIFAFFTGFFLAKVFQYLFPSAPTWAFLAGVAFGPSVIHGVTGPTENPFGNLWLQPNYDLSYLLVVTGFLIVVREQKLASSRSRSSYPYLAGGILIGLGFYAHPVVSIMILPFAILVLLRLPYLLKAIPWAFLGSLVGLGLAFTSYVVNAGVNKWDPSHGAFIGLDYYAFAGSSVLGLDGIPDYALAILPFAIGLPPSQEVIPGGTQSFFMTLFVLAVLIGSILSIASAARNRTQVSVLGAVCLTWLTVIAMLFAFITFVSPTWLYSGSLTVLFWLTLGALPIAFSHRFVGIGLTLAVLIIELTSTVSHNLIYLTEIGPNFRGKVAQQDQLISDARNMELNGVDIIYGSYYDVIPLGYASGGSLRTISNTYNRFPLTSEELAAPKVTVAINSKPSFTWGVDALSLVDRECMYVKDLLLGNALASQWSLYVCDANVIATNS